MVLQPALHYFSSILKKQNELVNLIIDKTFENNWFISGKDIKLFIDIMGEGAVGANSINCNIDEKNSSKVYLNVTNWKYLDEKSIMDIKRNARSKGFRICFDNIMNLENFNMIIKYQPNAIKINLNKFEEITPTILNQISTIVKICRKKGVKVVIGGVDNINEFELMLSVRSVLFFGDLFDRKSSKLEECKIEEQEVLKKLGKYYVK